jgi:LPXTG-motif cell wall-anchored protein
LPVTVLAAALTLLGAAPAVATEEYVDLRVTASFGAADYLATDDVELRVVVANAGTAPATGVVLASLGELDFGTGAWGELNAAGPGAVLAPGERVELTAMASSAGRDLEERVEVRSAELDREPADNVAVATATVATEPGDLLVTVYGDEDQDGVVDPGEPTVGALVALYGGGREYGARTDGAGAARFTGLPTGRYLAQVEVRGGWYGEESRPITVRPGVNRAEVRSLRNRATALTATVALDRDRYAAGDTVRARVTLTNPGGVDVTGVFAFCGRYGSENDLYSIGWGELDPAEEGPGAAVRAGETRSWEFTDVVPDRAWDYGFVVLRCDFSQWSGGEGAFAEDSAAVPGGRGLVEGTLVHDGRPVPGVELLLIDPVTGAAVARAVSDAAGGFRFPELPAGAYELRALGPWRLPAAGATWIQVMAGNRHGFHPLAIEPGPTQLAPGATPAAPPIVDPRAAPAPRTPVRPATLPDTGASVVELTAFGLLLVLTGAVLARRPRRA